MPICRRFRRASAHELIRWARNPRLLDAHEQVTYGDIMCWSGDAMRRDADKRNALTLFDESAGDAVRHGRLAFEALWTSCALVPKGRLMGPHTTLPDGAFEQADEPPWRRPAPARSARLAASAPLSVFH